MGPVLRRYQIMEYVEKIKSLVKEPYFMEKMRTVQTRKKKTTKQEKMARKLAKRRMGARLKKTKVRKESGRNQKAG